MVPLFVVIGWVLGQVGGPPPPLTPDAGMPTPLDGAVLPKHGSLEQFVPSGWKAVQDVVGDLSGDGKPDKAMLLCPDISVRQMEWEAQYDTCGACVPTSFNCAFVALLRQDSGWELWAFESPVEMNRARSVQVTLKNDVLQIHFSQGGHYSSSKWVNKYRNENGKLRLIGSEVQDNNDPGETSYTSANFLTGTTKSRKCSAGKGGKEVCSKWSTARVEQKLTYFGEGTLR